MLTYDILRRNASSCGCCVACVGVLTDVVYMHSIGPSKEGLRSKRYSIGGLGAMCIVLASACNRLASYDFCGTFSSSPPLGRLLDGIPGIPV